MSENININVGVTKEDVQINATNNLVQVNVNTAQITVINPQNYDLSEFTNTSLNPFVRTSGLSSYVPSFRSLTINGVTQDLSANRTFTIATGLTVGTTPISSGTIGRVLFEGAGNVLQESSNLFWDNTNGRLGIGTSSPTRSIDTAGIIRVGGTFVYGDTNNQYLQLSNVQGTYLGYNSSNVTIVASSVRLLANGVEVLRASQTGSVLIGTTTDAGYKLDVNGTARASTSLNTPYLFSSGPLSLYAGFSNRGRIDLSNSTTGFAINLQGNGGSIMQLHNTGNVLIGTTTDAGYKLDVNGTARLNDISFVSSGGNAREIRQTIAGTLLISNVGSNNNIDISTNRAGTQTNALRIVGGTGNVLINTTTDAGFRLDVNGTARVVTSILVGAGWGTGTVQTGVCRATYFNSYANNFTIFETNNSTGNAKFYQGVSVGTSSDPVASAQVEIVSTTKGFLPPRGTNAQMLAIASPATGLIFFDTTNNKLNCYDGTTWQPCW